MPPMKTYASLDTGSDLTWVQCKLCTHCYKQILPLFDPQKSSTYKIIGCQSKECKLVSKPTCVKKNVCEYEVQYGDGSYSTGDVASETFTFDSTSKKVDNISIPHVIFGSGHNNDGTFSNCTTGIVGLADTKSSFINQLDNKLKGNSLIAVVSGPNVLTTPMIRKKPDIFGNDMFYFLNFESISVGGKKLEFKSSQLMNSSDTNEVLGNIIIDSGTTLTFLPEYFYNKFESSLVETIKEKRRKSPPYIDLPICYETKSVVEFPNIVFHFTDADIEVLPMNTFSKVDEDVTCLTIVKGGRYSIYENLAQMNFLIGYDLVNHKFSFLPTLFFGKQDDIL
ncbi:hypothetical protein R3W88_021091 [Solanum pinnatisectum]|uniref:Peptidase A1 domain-containing protein n=1 Tax=Solanum pinnatisectum TaxID=50273 RepID=A0AAV9LRI3_9SOLN|nr:hypothetical protein R3W88_021091 [Solanum pinnatisectum]